MKTCLSVTKKGKNYAVNIDGEIYQISLDLLYKYYIKPLCVLDDKSYQSFKNDVTYEQTKNLGLKKLKAMMTTFEMKNYLESIGASPALIKQLLFEFREKKYLDDDMYTKMFVNFRSTQDGPQLHPTKIIGKRNSATLTEKYLNQIDEKEILEHLIPRKIKTYHRESFRQVKMKTKMHFIRKGFSSLAVDDVLNESFDLRSDDEYARLIIQFEKIFYKLQSKYEGYELRQKLFEKLYQKGFPSTNIDQLLKERFI